jgi:hypothetical protein
MYETSQSFESLVPPFTFADIICTAARSHPKATTAADLSAKDRNAGTSVR